MSASLRRRIFAFLRALVVARLAWLLCLLYLPLFLTIKLSVDLQNRPAFPTSWFLWVAFLCCLPIASALNLLWLFINHRNRRTASAARRRQEDGYTLLATQTHNRSEGQQPAWEESPARRNSPNRSKLHSITPIYSFWSQCLLCFVLICLAIKSCFDYEWAGDIRHRPALQAALTDPQPRSSGYARGEKIFIAANFYQNEKVLPYWTRTMHDVITWLGRDNVFVSIVESYSTDATPTLLRKFERELDARGVRSRILVDDTRITKPARLEWTARTDYLAALRNAALEPLRATGGYDRVLFSNDVFIEPESVIELLETNGGAFDFACALDFAHFGLYDMWVLRDARGHLASGLWPYFMDPDGSAAMRADEAPVPVFACWNGIVAFRADPLLPVHLRGNRTLSSAPLASPPPPGHPMTEVLGPSPALTPPLVFRSSAQGECFSSECFLLPYDFRRVMNLQDVYVNPRVITAYNWTYYLWYKWVLRQQYVKWFVERVWNGWGMEDVMTIVGDPPVKWWDGGDCHPWW